MKNLVVGVLVAFGLAACSEGDGGGTGGAGGIQDPEDTSSTGDPGSGGGTSGSGGDTSATTSTSSGGDCARGPSTEAVCDAVAICESDAGDCLAELDEERCADPACATAHDGWVACVSELADAGNWDVCPDFPQECDAERTVYEACVAPGACTEGPDAATVCAAAEACDSGSYDACIEELQAERCLYPEGECRSLFDGWVACVADVADLEQWVECPDYPDACAAERDDYASSCI